MAIASLIIRLQDQASQGIGKIAGALNGLGSRAQAASSGTSGLTGAMRNGVLQANAIQFAIGKATQAIGFLNSKFEEAKNLQLEQLNAVTTFSALTGQSTEQATRFIENLNSRLSKEAAPLPGITADYKRLGISIQDNLITAFKDANGTLDLKGAEDSLVSFASSYGALTAVSTKDIGNTGLGLTKALSGASIAELRSIAFFEQNPALLNEIEQRLTAQGKQLKDLNIRERVKLLQESGEKFITEDFKEQAAQTVDGLLQAFNSTLFDSEAGIFGIRRDLDLKTDGVQSAYTSMNEALKEVIGSDGIFFKISDILRAAGVQLTDPMAVLKWAVDIAVSGLKKVTLGLKYIEDFVKAGGSLTDSFRIGLALFPRFDTTEIVDNAIAFFTSFGDRAGEMITKFGGMIPPLFNRGVQMIGDGVSDTTFRHIYEISVAAGGMIGKALGAIVSILSQIDYPQLLMGIGKLAIGGFIGALKLIAVVAVGLIGGIGLGLVDGLRSALINIGTSIHAHVDTYMLAIGQTAIDGFNLLLSPIRNTFGKLPLIGGIVTGLLDTQIGALQALLTGGLSGMFAHIINTATSLISAVRQKMDEVVNNARSIPVVGAVVDRLIPPEATQTPRVAGASYSGNIGTAAGGFLGDLLGAAQTEMRNMPSGANLLLANSSENILPQGMLGELIRTLIPVALPAQAQSPTVATSAVQIQPAAMPPARSIAPSISMPMTININGASGDLQAIAQAVVNAIQSSFDAEAGAQIA